MKLHIKVFSLNLKRTATTGALTMNELDVVSRMCDSKQKFFKINISGFFDVKLTDNIFHFLQCYFDIR